MDTPEARPAFSKTRACVAAGVASALLLACPTGAGAQTTRNPGLRAPAPDLAQVIQELESDDFTTRYRAQSLLSVAGSPFSMREIERAIHDPALSPEARRRAIVAVKKRFDQLQDRAALGVSSVGRDPPVIIGEVVPGFDAARALRPNDVVESMAGFPLPSWEHMRRVIIMHDPGDVVEIKIRRNGEPLTVSVTLGSYADLRDRGSIDSVLAAAWNMRSGPLFEAEFGGREPIDPGLPPEAWADIDATPTGRAAVRGLEATDPRSIVGTTRITAGGEARGATEYTRVRRGGRQIGGALAPNDLRRQINSLEAMIAANQARIERGDLPADERARLLADTRQLEAQVNAYRQILFNLENRR